MLPYYAGQFSVVEIDNTWYRMPQAETVLRQVERVPKDFLFAPKLTRTMTHEVDKDHWRQQVMEYRDGIAPLIQDRKLAAVVVQFSQQFDRSASHRSYLAALLDELAGLPIAVEFRSGSWATDRVFAELEKRRVTLVTVDAPPKMGLFPLTAAVTNPELFYFRFHGRSTQGWRSGDKEQQFDYDYPDGELRALVEEQIETMAHTARAGILVFNNHVKGQACDCARRLRTMLTERGWTSR